jgi:hypothetical protein
MERPGMMVAESLVQTLRASGKYRSVLESSSLAAGDYLLRGKLYEFDEVDRETIQTSISLQVDLEDVKTKRIVWDDLVQRDEPVGSKNVKDVVASLDRNLRAVVKETAAGRSSFSTNSGRTARQVGDSKASPDDRAKVKTRSRIGDIIPASAIPASTDATTTIHISVNRIILRRSRMSPIAPAGRASTKNGRAAAVCVRATYHSRKKTGHYRSGRRR